MTVQNDMVNTKNDKNGHFWERERQRETDSHRKTERQRQRERQTDREREREREKQREIQRERHRGKGEGVGRRGLVILKNKARYTATPVVCGWAGAVIEKVTSVSSKT